MFGLEIKTTGGKLVFDEEHVLNNTFTYTASQPNYTTINGIDYPWWSGGYLDTSIMMFGRVDTSTVNVRRIADTWSGLGDNWVWGLTPAYGWEGKGTFKLLTMAASPGNIVGRTSDHGMEVFDQYGNRVFSTDIRMVKLKHVKIVNKDNTKVTLEEYPLLSGHEVFYYMDPLDAAGYFTRYSGGYRYYIRPHLTVNGVQWLDAVRYQTSDSTYYDKTYPLFEIAIQAQVT